MPKGEVPSRSEQEADECLHCAIIDIVDERIAAGGANAAVPAWLKRFGTEIAVTDRRVIYKTGLVQRDTTEINMAKIESVDVSQSILGRVFDLARSPFGGRGKQ